MQQMLFREWLSNGTNICKIIYFLNANRILYKFFFTAEPLCRTLLSYCAIPWHCKASAELHLAPSPFQTLFFSAYRICSFTCATKNSLRGFLINSGFFFCSTPLIQKYFRAKLCRKRFFVLIPCLVWKGLLSDCTEITQHQLGGFFLTLCANTKVRWG